MTDLNNEVRELTIEELTIDELDAVSGGLPIPIVQIANMVRVALYDKMVRDLNIHIYTGPLI
jgi:bacteriocin-like protein